MFYRHHSNVDTPIQHLHLWLANHSLQKVRIRRRSIMRADGDWQAVEGALSKDTATIGEYLQTWKLKLSTTNTESAAFYLNNKEAKRELKVYNNTIQPFCPEPKHLGVTLDRTLTHRRHLGPLRKELTSRVALLRRLAGLGWGNNGANSHLSPGPFNSRVIKIDFYSNGRFHLCSFTWSRFPNKILLIDSLLTPIVESTCLNIDICTSLNHRKKVKSEPFGWFLES